MTIKRVTLALTCVFFGWIAVMAAVMRVTDAAPAAVVIFPTETLLAALPDETSILGLNRYALTVANRTNTTESLYSAGAWLVLPAGLTGCLPLTQTQRAKLA